MTEELVQIVRSVWAQYGGQGDPPPIIVTPAQYEDFKAAGFPEHMMQINQPLPRS